MNKHYTSEITQFLNNLKQERPDLHTQQQQGRALLWDKPVDLQVLSLNSAARLPNKAYAYATQPTVKKTS